MAMQSPSLSSSFSSAFTYQVFLSFRGTDTRHGFTGNLYNALTKNGIHTFIDDNDLERGDEITPSLIKAIEESRIFVPIFSANYASSSFCLDELVHIIHCYKTKGRLILPVFVGVDPTDVRHHTGSYGEDLTKHEERFQNNKKNMERWHQWKMALTQAANLSGYHYSTGYEYMFIEEIVKSISNKISRTPLHVANYPVGLQSQVQQVKSLLDNGSDDGVHMVGIYGIGGLGKSTLARAIYNFVADQFESLCFLHDVRENSAKNSLKHLQEKLLLKTTGWEIELDHVSEGIPKIKERLCRKKILLILDDVDNIDQLHALAGEHDWFGRGSRVIITTRNKHLLSSHGIESTHAVEGLNETKALELLRWMAFKSDIVPSCYEEILNRAVAYASGLPLVLEIVGSNLFGKNIDEWKDTLDGYEKIPNKKIQEILKVSYDALEEEEQSVFLDIACCFKGCVWEEVKYILHSHYGHCITHHVRVLVEKSLINLWGYYVTLHDMIEGMGKEVVRQESPKEPGERSRLWCQDDIVYILKENTGSSKIEMIHLNCSSMEPVIDWNGKAFMKMTKLKTLIIENDNFSKGPKYLPSSLRVLRWKRCTSESLSSSILSKKFNDMKVLTLDHCEYLNHIPDVSGLPNLEKFSFQDCANLSTIHNSIGCLNKLEILDANSCPKLESFPALQLPSLKEFYFYYCENLTNFPELLCKMTNIKNIQFYGTTIEELPFSFQYLSELCLIGEYPYISKHNDKMNSSQNVVLSKVECIDLIGNFFDKCLGLGCYLSDECIQMLLKWCLNVRHLDLSESNLKILPECLRECHLLKELYLDDCKFLEEIIGFPPNLEKFFANRCYSLSSSSRRMLLSQKLHEAGCTDFQFPYEREGIPDWFEHQSRGYTISFWFRKKIPSITFIILLKSPHQISQVNLSIDDARRNLLEVDSDLLPPEHAVLFDLKLEENIHNMFKSEIFEALLENEWIHVELTLEDEYFPVLREDIADPKNIEMGIHVLKEKSNTEEDVIFNNPYRRRKFWKRKQHKFSIPMDLVSGMQNLRLTETKENQRLVEVGVSEKEILQQQHLPALVSDMGNLDHTEQHLDLLSGIRNKRKIRRR